MKKFFLLTAKKRVITLLFLAVTMSAVAEDHMKFMGIPINGQLSTFCQALEKKNFRLEKMYTDRARYEGSFTGKPVYVIVEATPNTQTVCDVLVAYKDNRTWEELEDLYSGLKEQLTAKYGRPVEWHQLGDAPKNASFTDIQRKLADAELTRRAKFDTETGTIDLGIDNLRLFGGQIGILSTYIIYIDKANTTKRDQEAYDDL